MMNFYMNADASSVMTEPELVDAFIFNGIFDDRKEALKSLRENRETYGWVSCTVSQDIAWYFTYCNDERSEN